ncbi:MAG: IS4 family transposase [Candidatus Symbiodolus clandestinus]
MDWAMREMGTVELGEQRLNHRVIALLDRLGANAQASIPVACGSWAETKAAYRLFVNAKVNAEKVLSPHRQAILERIKQEKTVLIVQDTTPLNFSGQLNRTDIGPLTGDKHRGILLHPTVAVTPKRVCLGVIDNYHWSREALRGSENSKEKNRENHKIPFKVKESYRWVMGYQKAQEIARLAETTRIVTVADREGDLSDLYHEAYTSTQSTSAYWLIRAIRNRRLLDAKGNFQRLKMIEMVKNTQPVGTIELELPASTHSGRRQVQQAIYAAQVRLNPPDRKRKKTSHEIVEAYVVIATELNPPTNQAPIEWVLLTHVDFNDQVTPYVIVQWYLCRWQIEVYFRILKSGCQTGGVSCVAGHRSPYPLLSADKCAMAQR